MRSVIAQQSVKVTVTASENASEIRQIAITCDKLCHHSQTTVSACSKDKSLAPLYAYDYPTSRVDTKIESGRVLFTEFS